MRVDRLESNVDLATVVSGVGGPIAPQFPIVLAGNESQALDFFFNVPTQTGRSGAAIDDFAQRVAHLTEIGIVIEWRYVRSSGLPYKHGRRTDTRTVVVEVDPAEFRKTFADSLRAGGRSEFAELIAPTGA